MRKLIGSMAMAVALLVAGTAYALTVTLRAPGGAPGSTVTADIACPETPSVYVHQLDTGPPPATVVPETGTETGPGQWTYTVTAGDRDVVLDARCGDDTGRARYDVDEPALFPGPTVANFGQWRPDLDRTAVVGTDCPAGSTATVTFRGTGAADVTRTVAIDGYGDWQSPVPAAFTTGPVTVTAHCGAVAYSALTFEPLRRPLPPTPPAGPGPVAPAPAPAPGPAVPVPGAPAYTG